MDERTPSCSVPRMESLEQRLLLSIAGPLSIAGGDTLGFFTDSNGDVVTVSITGSAGTVNFTDTSLAAGVANGQDIATITITGASSNFKLTFSDDDSSAAGGGDIFLGDITSNRPINAILTVGGSDGVSEFLLGSYFGALSAGGRIQVYNIEGNIDGIGLQMPGLGAGQVINVANDIRGNVVLNGTLAGTFIVGDDWESELFVGGGVAKTGQIIVSGDVDSAVTVIGCFLGSTKIDGAANGEWTIGGSVGVGAVLAAADWEDLIVNQNFLGKLVANDDDIYLDVYGSVGGKASIIADENIYLDVDGNVAAGAEIDATDGELDAYVLGTANGTWRAGDGLLYLETDAILGGEYFGTSMQLRINDGIAKATLGGGDIDVEAGRAIANTTLVAAGSLELSAASLKKVSMDAENGADVEIVGNAASTRLVCNSDILLLIGGNLTGSTITTGSDLTGEVDGQVCKSVLTAAGDVGLSMASDGEEVLALAADNIPAFIVGNGFINSSIIANGDMTFEVVAGGVKNSTVSGGYTVLELTGDVTNSNLVGIDFLDLTLYGNLVSGRVGGEGTDDVGVDASIYGSVGKKVMIEAAGDYDLMLFVSGNFAGQASTGSNAEIEIDGSVQKGAVLYSDDNMTLYVGDDFEGKLDTTNLDLYVDGDVLRNAVIGATDASDLDADSLGFYVGGSFAGKLNLAGDLTDGTGIGVTTVIENGITKTGIFNVLGSLNGSSGLAFGGSVLGRMTLGTLDADLIVEDDLQNLTIAGGVNVEINAGGEARHIRTGSYFVPNDEFEGLFGNGDLNIPTGELVTGDGWFDVAPLALIV